MMGDVPVGVFLSGGLDSSIVAAVAARYLAERGETLQTFAVGTAGSPDVVAARQVAEFIGSDHHEVLYDAEQAIEALPGVVRRPSSRSTPPSSAAPCPTSSWPGRRPSTSRSCSPARARTSCSPATSTCATSTCRRTCTTSSNAPSTACTTSTCSGPTASRCAHSLEARVPFLDREVIDWAMRLPIELKIPRKGEMEKQVLREAFAGWLPEELLWRVKAQFGDGSGARDVLSDEVAADIDDAEFEAERVRGRAAAAHQGGARLLPRLAGVAARRGRRQDPHPVRDRLSRRAPIRACRVPAVAGPSRSRIVRRLYYGFSVVQPSDNLRKQSSSRLRERRGCGQLRSLSTPADGSRRDLVVGPTVGAMTSSDNPARPRQ